MTKVFDLLETHNKLFEKYVGVKKELHKECVAFLTEVVANNNGVFNLLPVDEDGKHSSKDFEPIVITDYCGDYFTEYVSDCLYEIYDIHFDDNNNLCVKMEDTPDYLVTDIWATEDLINIIKRVQELTK